MAETSPAVLSTLRSLVAGPSGAPANTPDATSFSIGFLAALGAKELEDQQAGAQREQAKAAKSNASMLGGNIGQADQLVTLARFAQSGMLPQLMAGGQPSPLVPPQVNPMMGPPNPMMAMAAGRPPLPMGGPAPMGPGPMGPGGPPMGPPPGGPPMAGPMGPPPMGPPQGAPPGMPGAPGAIPPAILMALQSLMRPNAGLV